MEQVEQQKKEIADFKNLNGGLELLVQLAEKGEIDPWDIDIIEVTDKYLAALNKTPRENLLNAGRAIFYVSVLLRLKSDILLNISNETLLRREQQEDFFPEDELLFQADGPILDISKLESFLARSSLCKQQRNRKISLSDLIFALKQAEEEEERRALRARLKTERAFRVAPIDAPEDVLEIVYEDDVEEIVNKVEAIIQEYLTSEEPITLTFLSSILNDKLNPFLALLFLANLQKLVLEQKEFYGEVFMHKAGTVIEEGKDIQKGVIDKIAQKIRGRKKGREVEVINSGSNITS